MPQAHLGPRGEKLLGCLWEGLWGPPGLAVAGGLGCHVCPVWLQEQFSQHLGLGPDLSVAGEGGASGLD